MAGKYSGSSCKLYVDGYDLLGSNPKGLNVKLSSAMEDTTGLGSSAIEQSPVGLTSVELTQEGAIWDTGTAEIHAAMVSSLPTSPQATARVVSLGFAGTTRGVPAYGVESTFNTEYEVIAEQGGLTKANVTYNVSGALNDGVVVEYATTKTADWNTESSSVDNAASSSGGAVAHQQVFTLTGFSAYVGTVRDSPNDSAWSDLIVFDDEGTTIGAQRKTVAGTVDRYLSYAGNVTGTGTVSVFVTVDRT